MRKQLSKKCIGASFEYVIIDVPNGSIIHSLGIKSTQEIRSLDLVFPKLKHINYVVGNEHESYITVNDEDLQDLFRGLGNTFFDNIVESESFEYNLQLLNTMLRSFLKLAEKDRSWNVNQLKGFYAELLFLKKKIEEDGDDAIVGWQRPNKANHDFIYDDNIHEVKAVALHNTTVKITSEYQLWSPENQILYLELYRIESLLSSGKDTIGQCYSKIISLLNDPFLIDEFKTKCLNDDIGYMGPEINPIPYRFISHEATSYKVEGLKFPRILPSSVDGISRISYDIALNAIEDFKVK
jgi:hypothetical protein